MPIETIVLIFALLGSAKIAWDMIGSIILRIRGIKPAEQQLEMVLNALENLDRKITALEGQKEILHRETDEIRKKRY